MSEAVFPTLPGITWKTMKTPAFKTLIQQASSGKETRAGLMAYPLWTWELEAEFLRSAPAKSELQTLAGFFLARHGSLEAFQYQDDEDYSVTGQAIATGDGVVDTFQMVRTWGGFTEPTRAIYGTPKIYVAGVEKTLTTHYTIDKDTGILTFVSPPTGAITADFTYRWRVRFAEDEMDFERFMKLLWQAKKISFVSVKDFA